MLTDYIPPHPTHITYRLYGSIPNLPLTHLHTKLKLRKAEIEKAFDRPDTVNDSATRKERRVLIDQSELDYYLGFDKLLDHPTSGPMYLASPAAKEMIIKSWHHVAKQRNLTIYAISVMSNHVHIILKANVMTDRISLREVMRDHKKFTGTQLNRLHGTPGRRVWAEKEYSRIIRHDKFETVLWYVLNNPVKAGLTDDAVGWYGNFWAPELKGGFIDLRVA